jgi:hypothetical protein
VTTCYRPNERGKTRLNDFWFSTTATSSFMAGLSAGSLGLAAAQLVLGAADAGRRRRVVLWLHTAASAEPCALGSSRAVTAQGIVTGGMRLRLQRPHFDHRAGVICA